MELVGWSAARIVGWGRLVARFLAGRLGRPERPLLQRAISGRRAKGSAPGWRAGALSSLFAVALVPGVRAQSASYDVVIHGGRIIDGSGAPWYQGDIGIRDGRIVAIGRIEPARGRRAIDATGLIVAPGFVDMMGQTAAPFIKDPNAAFNLLSQGITTLNAGEGESDAPLSDAEARERGWKSMSEFFARLEGAGLPMNMVQTVGHTRLRELVIGDKDRQATPPELDRMRQMVREAMEAGAIGVSTSLIYPPAIYASEAEITELAKVAGQYGGRYFTHMRNEGDRLLEAIDEALRIGKAANTPVHIYHLKTAGQGNWSKMDLALARIKAARASGQQVGADIYPYVNNGLGIRALLHPRHATEGQAALLAKLSDAGTRAEMRREMESLGGWENWFAHAGKDWDRIVVAHLPAPYTAMTGQTIGAIARTTKRDPWDLFFELAREEVFAMPQTMSEANKIKAMREEFTSFDTDAGPVSPNGYTVHPRGFGAFPRVLARYVRDLGALSLEAAIHRMSAVAANEVMAYDRGRLSPGLAADVVVFDFDRIRDRATFGEPSLASEGMKYVLVNGTLVFEDGKYNGAKPGKVLRGPGWRNGDR